MYSDCLSFSRIPHITPLFASYLRDFSRVERFYARPPHQTSWLADEASGTRYDKEHRMRVSVVLERQNRGFGASQKTLANIARLRDGACVAVTGQQVGLFGGPLFSLLKALTAVRLAEEAARAGHDCVPVFWLAANDHDLAEVDHVLLPASDGTLHKLTTPTRGVEGAPVGDIHFGAEIEPVVAEASELLGASDVVDALRESYRPGASFGEAFGRLFARIFSEFGVILLDANDRELHKMAGPLYAEAIRRASEFDTALLARGEELHKSGFHEQVKVTPSSTLLFEIRDGVRTVIHRQNGQFRAGEEKLSESELLDRIAAAPERFSANALLRPVVQDFLLPTLVYAGGPAEVAYFAQAAVLFEKLLGRVTPIWPRLSMTLVEPHIGRLLERYKLAMPDVFRDEDHLRRLVAERTLPDDLERNFASASASLEQSLRSVTESLGRLDSTLVNAANRASAKMRYQLNRLRSRAGSAELRRNEILSRHASQLSHALFPGSGLQERGIGGLYFLARYPGLLSELHEMASLSCPDHQVVHL